MVTSSSEPHIFSHGPSPFWFFSAHDTKEGSLNSSRVNRKVWKVLSMWFCLHRQVQWSHVNEVSNASIAFRLKWFSGIIRILRLFWASGTKRFYDSPGPGMHACCTGWLATPVHYMPLGIHVVEVGLGEDASYTIIMIMYYHMNVHNSTVTVQCTIHAYHDNRLNTTTVKAM